MKAGPKRAVLDDPLPFTGTGPPSEQFRQFAEQYLRLANDQKMILAPFQVDLVASVWDPEPRPRMAGWALARGSAKSTLAAGMAVHTFLMGGDDTSVDVVAVSEQQSRIIFNSCAKFIARHPDLESRVQVFKDRLVIPSRGSELVCLPASPAMLEGRSPDLCICDEGGRLDREVFEVVSLATGKKESSLILVVGTPGPQPDNVLAGFRQHAREHPDDKLQVYREISAAGFEDHPPDCDDHGDGPGTGCISIANPALAAGFAHRDGIISCLPPKITESHYRRTRLVQWVTGVADPVLPPGVWQSLATGEGIPDGSEVVLSFDGSYSGTDATVVLAATVSPTPHMDVIGYWKRPPDADDSWRIPILEVEQTIRDACERFVVREICADSYRYQRSLEVLKAEGLPVTEFPQSISRMSAATADFLTACTSDQLSHSGDEVLAEHIGNAVLTEDNRGGRMVKASRSKLAGLIDAAICACMAHSRATWLANRPEKPRRGAGFATRTGTHGRPRRAATATRRPARPHSHA